MKVVFPLARLPVMMLTWGGQAGRESLVSSSYSVTYEGRRPQTHPEAQPTHRHWQPQATSAGHSWGSARPAPGAGRQGAWDELAALAKQRAAGGGGGGE